MSYAEAIAEMKLEAEEAVMKKLQSIIKSKSEFVGLDEKFWAEKIYKMSEQDKTIEKLRSENRVMKQDLKQIDKLKSDVDECHSIIDEKCAEIKVLKEKVAELEKNPTTENAVSAMEICVDLEKEKYEKEIAELKENIDELEERIEEMGDLYEWDDVIETILNDTPMCIETAVIRKALEDGEVVSYEMYEEEQDTKDEYELLLENIHDLYKSKHTKGLHKPHDMKYHYEDLPKAIEELYKLYEAVIIERDYYKNGYDTLKESGGEEVAIEMMEKIMDKTKSIAENDIKRVEEIHRLQMKINNMISSIRHQYKTRVEILEQCNGWTEKIIDIHSY